MLHHARRGAGDLHPDRHLRGGHHAALAADVEHRARRSFVVTPATTTLTYTGATSTFNGQSVTVSGVLTSGGAPVAGQTVTLTLGSGSRCRRAAPPSPARRAPPAARSQASTSPSGRSRSTVAYAGNAYYQPSSARARSRSARRRPPPADREPRLGHLRPAVTVSATLIDTYTGTSAPGRAGDVHAERHPALHRRRPTPAASPRAPSRPPSPRGPTR